MSFHRRYLCTFSKHFGNKEFYKSVDWKSTLKTTHVIGDIVDNAIDLKNVRPGETINIPYEITISPSMCDFWHSAFYSHDRINTSTPFARQLKLQDQIIPFGLMLFLTGSMSHADHAKLQTGYSHAKYIWPGFAGDTFKKRFIIRSLRSTSDGNHSLFKIDCELRNQRNVIIFTCEKTMLFPFKVQPSEISINSTEESQNNQFLSHIINQAETLQSLGSQSLSILRPETLLIHTLTRPLSETHMMQLATLARLTHEKHFNTRKYRREELLVPGGLVLGLTTSIASRDLHEVLHEEVIECSFPNNLAPGDTVGAISYIQGREEHVTGDIEAISVRTLGFKNTDVQTVMVGKSFPIELFTSPSMMRPHKLEEFIKKECPEFSKSIVCIVDRKIYRQTPKHVPFLL